MGFAERKVTDFTVGLRPNNQDGGGGEKVEVFN